MEIPGLANTLFTWPSLKSSTKLQFSETEVVFMQMLLNNFTLLSVSGGFLGGAAVKDLANARDTSDVGSISGLERSPGRRNRNPLQYSCLENAMDKAAWRATVHVVAESHIQLSMDTHKCIWRQISLFSAGKLLILMLKEYFKVHQVPLKNLKRFPLSFNTNGGH